MLTVVGDRRVVAHDVVRIQLRHARRTDHHRGRAGLLRIQAVFETSVRTFGGGADDDGHAPSDVIDHGFEHGLAFTIGQASDFGGDAERGQSIYAGCDEEIDNPAQAVEVERVVDVKWRWKY